MVLRVPGGGRLRPTGARRPARLQRRTVLALVAAVALAGTTVAAILLVSSAGHVHARSAGGPTPSATSAPSTPAITAGSTAPPPTTVPPTSAPPAGFVPWSFTAISPTQWWLLGSTPCGPSLCLAVVTTDDGGRSFRSVGAPGGSFLPTRPDDAVADQVRFADADDGWAFGPELYATHDGGRTWNRISLPGTVLSLEPGLGKVYAVVDDVCHAASCPSNPTPAIWTTSPSSDEWAVDPAGTAVSGGLAVHGRSVWVMNAQRTPDGPAVGFGLLHSSDGGTTFSLEPQPVPGIECTYSPVSDAVVWAYCSGGHFMFAYRSTDAGTSFVPLDTQTSGPASPEALANGSTLEAATPMTAVAAGDLPGEPLVRTSDGGASWSIVAEPPSASGNWAVIGFTTPTVGYVFWEPGANQRQLWRTTDGGVAWSPVQGV